MAIAEKKYSKKWVEANSDKLKIIEIKQKKKERKENGVIPARR